MRWGNSWIVTAAIAAPKSGFVASRGLVRAAPTRIWLMFRSVQPRKKWIRPASEKYTSEIAVAVPKEAEIFRGGACEREHPERYEELEKRREVGVAHAADCAAVERLKDPEAESGSRSQQRSRHG